MGLKSSTGRKQAEKTQLQAHTIFHEKGRMTQRVEPIAKMVEARAMENCSQAWKPSQGPSAQPDFKTAMNQGRLHMGTLDFLLCWTRPWKCLRPPHRCTLVVLRSEDTTLQFHRSTDEEHLSLRCPRSCPHTQTTLRWLLDFELMLTYTVKRIYFSSSNKSDVWHQYNLTCLTAWNL